MTQAKRPPATKTREILVYLSNGQKMLVGDIPANAKITFGKLQPGERDFHSGGNALRIYTTTNNQLAVFCGVSSFRDLSLTVKEQKISRKLKSNAVTGPNGQHRDEDYDEVVTWETVQVEE